MTGNYDDSIWETIPDEDRVPSAALTRPIAGFLGGTSSVLDLGCGDGQFLPLLEKHCEQLFGADRSAVALERARRRAPGARLVQVGEDHRLPLEDNCVERIWCVDTIEHVVDTQTFLSEARRVLTPGGRMLVATPGHPARLRMSLAVSGWDEHFDPFSPHLRFYTAGSLRGALDAIGFEVVKMESTGGLLVAEAVRL